MRTAGNVALGAFGVTGFLNLGEFLFDPDGTWWLVLRAAASVVFTVAAVTWLILWVTGRRTLS